VKRNARMPHRATVVQLQVVRAPHFYLTSIIGVLVMLSALSFVVFVLPVCV
jgi:hypothetical protein